MTDGGGRRRIYLAGAIARLPDKPGLCGVFEPEYACLVPSDSVLEFGSCGAQLLECQGVGHVTPLLAPAVRTAGC